MAANDNHRFDEKISISLRKDEAVVLFWYFSREILDRGQTRLKETFDDPAESHAVQALFQELVPRLILTGSEENQGIELAARESLMAYYGPID